MLGLGSQELIIVLVIVLILFGGAKLPQMMKGLGERILTTHVGSLVRPVALLDMVIDQVRGETIDNAAFEALVT